MKKFLLSFILFFSFTSFAELINRIEVRGNQRIEKETVTSLLDIDVGQDVDSDKIDNALKNLYNSGMFSKVDISLKDGVLLVSCVENPRINKIIIEGNEKISSDKILPEINLKERDFFSKDKALVDAALIKSIYQASGRYMVTVQPKIVEVSANRVDLIFEVDEGKKTKIRKILFEGNENFTDTGLKTKIISEESRWYRFFSDNDLYVNERVEYDRDMLINFYQSRGYAAVKVVSSAASFSSDLDGVVLTFTIEEGPNYNIGNVKIEGHLKDVDFSLMAQNLSTQKGDRFDINNIEKDIDYITKTLNDKGYAFIDVDYEKTLGGNSADIEFVVTQGYRVFVNRINISGNQRTSEKVIRREFRLHESEPFSKTKLDRSIQRLRGLSYFKNVKHDLKKTDIQDKVDIDLNVEEESTTSLNFGLGYHTLNKVFGKIGITETNFLGNGQYVDANITMAKTNSEIDLSFTEPYFLDRNLAVGFDLFSTEQKKDALSYLPFTNKSFGGTLRAGYSITDNIKHGVRYSYIVSNNNKASSAYISSYWGDQQLGRKVKSLIGQTFSYNSTDIESDPTTGYVLSFDQAFAGLGGQTKYLRHEVSAKGYYNIFDGNIFMLGAKGGIINGLSGRYVRTDDRFELGGDSLRGFDYYGIGPRAKIIGFNGLENDFSLGGTRYYALRAEVKIPFEFQKEMGLHAKLFLDAGNVWGIDKKDAGRSDILQSNKIRAATGVGLGFNSMFGPISVYYGRPIKRAKFDQVRYFGITFSINGF
jgi:outer membrane protein insertion porin family